MTPNRLRWVGALVILGLLGGAWWFTREPGSDRAGTSEQATDGAPPVSVAGGVRSERPTFTDVTAEFGLGDVPQQERGAVTSREVGPADVMTGGVAVVDVNADGWEDLFFPRLRLPDVWMLNDEGNGFLPAPPGTLPDSAQESHAASAWGDLDADGDVDGVVGGIGDGTASLYLQGGDGRFTDATAESGLIIPPNAEAGEQLVFGLSLADLDADGDLDLVVSGWRHNSMAAEGQTGVFLNDGSAGFTEVPDAIPNAGAIAGFTATAADLDADGAPDLAIAADWGLSRLLKGNGDGTFADVTESSGVGTDENGMGSVVADVDGDDDLDWFVTSVSAPECAGPLDAGSGGVVKGCTGNRLFINDGRGRFDDGTDAYGVRDGEWGWGADGADLDNDGDLDLVQTNGFRPPNPPPGQERYVDDSTRAFFNDGGGLVEDAAAAGLANDGDGKAVVSFDVDHDGDLDVLEVENLEGPVLYRNDRPVADDWAEVQLVDPRGAPVAEATVWLHSADERWRRDIRAGDSYLAQRPGTAHFGLPEESPRQLKVVVSRPGDATPQEVGVVDRGEMTVLEVPG
ncbi:MAG: CRTAC1 family protein [Microthrixaceae bacterium]